MIAYRSSAPSIVLTILVVPLALVVAGAGAVAGFAGQLAGLALYLMSVLATGALLGIVAVPSVSTITRDQAGQRTGNSYGLPRFLAKVMVAEAWWARNFTSRFRPR